jgi:hypothetical protein
VIIVTLILIFAVIFIGSQTSDNEPPTAVIDSPNNGQIFSEEDEIEFNAIYSSDPENDDLSFYWNSNISGDLGYDRVVESKLELGFHEITLTVIDSEANENISRVYITVYPLPFVLINSSDSSQDYYSSEEIFFNGSKCSSKYSPNLNYTWRSDIDGVIGSSKIYYNSLSVGSHLITLEVNDGLSTCQEQITITVNKNTNPIAVIDSPKYNDVFIISSQIYFDGSESYDPDDHDLSFNWTSNIEGQIGTEETFYTNLSIGTHIINLKICDGHGCFSETSVVIDINSPPTADAGDDKVAEVGEQIMFDGSNSHDPENDELIYKWDFGDGNKDVGKAVIHSYLIEGIYNVTLTVDDGKKGIDSDSIQVEVIYVFQGTGVFGYVYNLKTQMPIADIELDIHGWEEETNDFFYDNTRTNESGYYEFHTPAGEFYLSSDNDYYYGYNEEIIISNNVGIELDIFLTPKPPETAKIFGYVYDNQTKVTIEDASISIDSDSGYYNFTRTNIDGYYEVNVPADVFNIWCFVWGNDEDITYEDYYVEVTVTDYQNLRYDIYLIRYIPSDLNITIEFANWDQITLTREMVHYSSTSSMREDIDENEDGQVTQPEVESYETYMENEFDFIYTENNYNTQDLFFVDNIFYNYIPNSITIEIEDAIGSTASTEPLTYRLIMNLKSNQTIPVSNIHDFSINVEYDDSQANYEFWVKFPILFEMTNYSATENVNVTGSNVVYIDPCEDLNPNDDYDDELVSIEVTRTI